MIKKSLALICLVVFCGCSGVMSDLFMGKNIYDVYGLSVDERGLYTIAKDRKIITKIQAYIASLGLSKALSIDVESFYGQVYLIGEYSSVGEKNKIIEYTRRIEGVRHVTTYLQKDSNRKNCSSVEDLSLITQIKSSLLANESIWGTDIHVHVVQCNAVLAGIVKTTVEKEKAIYIAKHTSGIKSVTSFIRAIY